MVRPPLPVRDGVGPSCVSLPAGPWPTIAAYMIERFPAISPTAWRERIDAGDVVDEHGRVVDADSPLQPRLRVYYYRALDSERSIPFEEQVIHRDAHLLVVDKPHFVPVSPVGKYLHESLLVRLKRKLGIDDLVPLHRIDRETAGLVLFSVERATRGVYHALFSERRITKHYEAIVPWHPSRGLPSARHSRLVDDDRHFMRMREVEGEPNSETRFRMLEQGAAWARLELSPVTGRRHQLRVHCANLGMPIRNDAIYPELLPEGADDFDRPLQLLARDLSFIDPLSGADRQFQSQLKLGSTD